jgi:hypothetical protein
MIAHASSSQEKYQIFKLSFRELISCKTNVLLPTPGWPPNKYTQFDLIQFVKTLFNSLLSKSKNLFSQIVEVRICQVLEVLDVSSFVKVPNCPHSGHFQSFVMVLYPQFEQIYIGNIFIR